MSPSAAAASAPSAPSSPSAASASAGFSGSFITVGAASVAITKSLPWIVGVTSVSSFTEEILKLSPISTPSKSIVRFSGIFSLGHFNSTLRLTILRTPPLFNPGDFSWLIKFTGTSILILTPGNTLRKSTWVGSSLKIWYFTSRGNTFWDFPSTFNVIIFDRKFSLSIRTFNNFLEIEIFWFWSLPP